MRAGVCGHGFRGVAAVEAGECLSNLKLQRPLWLEQLPDGRMFVLEQRGTILELPKNAKGDQAKVLFDISGASRT